MDTLKNMWEGAKHLLGGGVKGGIIGGLIGFAAATVGSGLLMMIPGVNIVLGAVGALAGGAFIVPAMTMLGAKIGAAIGVTKRLFTVGDAIDESKDRQMDMGERMAILQERQAALANLRSQGMGTASPGGMPMMGKSKGLGI